MVVRSRLRKFPISLIPWKIHDRRPCVRGIEDAHRIPAIERFIPEAKYEPLFNAALGKPWAKRIEVFIQVALTSRWPMRSIDGVIRLARA